MLLAALDMVDFHSCLKLTGADTHECDTVTVCLVHIRLDLKYKGGEIFSQRIDHACQSVFLGSGEVVIFQEMLQESLDTEVCECGSEEYRGKLSGADKLLIKLIAALRREARYRPSAERGNPGTDDGIHVCSLHVEMISVATSFCPPHAQP